MKIVDAYPPNYEKIAAVFDIKGKPVVFTYGHTLYNPGGFALPDHLIAHEEVHARQQTNDPQVIEAWWDEYLVNPEFRLRQELEAYRAQFQFFCSKGPSRQSRKMFLKAIAKDLSSAIYGHIISFEHAKEKIST